LAPPTLCNVRTSPTSTPFPYTTLFRSRNIGALFACRLFGQQPLGDATNFGAHVLTLQRQRQRGFDHARLAAAVIAPSVKRHGVERLAADHRGHRIGELDLSTRSLLLLLERAHHVGLEDVASGNDLVRRRLVGCGLLHPAVPLGERTFALAGIHYAVA